MGLNTLYGENQEETNRLVKLIADGVEKEGEVFLSWSCEGRTRHFWQSEQWESNLPQYDFEIGYNYYCKVTKRNDENKCYIDMTKNNDEIWLGKELLENHSLLQNIEEKMNSGLKVILRFPQLPNKEYNHNIMFLVDDINGTLNKVDFIKKGRTKVTKTDDDKTVIDFIIGG